MWVDGREGFSYHQVKCSFLGRTYGKLDSSILEPLILEYLNASHKEILEVVKGDTSGVIKMK